MSKDSKKSPSGAEPEEWQEELYTPERIEKWIRGEMNLAQLDGYTPEEMIEFAEMGYAQYQNGKYEEARVIFTGLIAMDGKEPYYRNALGCVFMAQEKLDRAIEMFSEALALDSKDQASLVNRGEAYLRDGKLMEAAADFKAAVDLDPKNESPYSGRAKALAAAALETLEAAIEEASQGEAKQPAAKAPPTPKKK